MIGGLGADYGIYGSDDAKCSGFVEKNPDNFIVRETFGDRIVTYGDPGPEMKFKRDKGYLHLTLVKRGISTFDCFNAIAEVLGIDKTAITYCGLKILWPPQRSGSR